MAKGISIHVGLNRLDANHSCGWQGILRFSEKDAQDMQEIATGMGYTKTDLLLTQSATINAVTSKIEDAAQCLVTGDILLLTYSGHGYYRPDQDGDEKDGYDETWCLYDGELIDDKLYDMWANFARGVRILVISNSCYSGTIIKMRKVPPIKRKINAAVLSLTACQDHQAAREGVFPAALHQVWDSGKFKGDYRSFHRQIMEEMKNDPNAKTPQTPNLFAIGNNTDNFLAQRPFEI